MDLAINIAWEAIRNRLNRFTELVSEKDRIPENVLCFSQETSF